MWSSEGPPHVVVVPRVDAPVMDGVGECCPLLSLKKQGQLQIMQQPSRSSNQFFFVWVRHEGSTMTMKLVRCIWTSSQKEYRTNDTKMGA